MAAREAMRASISPLDSRQVWAPNPDPWVTSRGGDVGGSVAITMTLECIS